MSADNAMKTVDIFNREDDTEGFDKAFFVNLSPTPLVKSKEQLGFITYQAGIVSVRKDTKISLALTMADTYTFFNHTAMATNYFGSDMPYEDLIFDITETSAHIRFTEAYVHNEQVGPALQIMYTGPALGDNPYYESFTFDEVEELFMEYIMWVKNGGWWIRHTIMLPDDNHTEAQRNNTSACPSITLQLESNGRAGFILSDVKSIREFIVNVHEFKEFIPVLTELQNMPHNAPEVSYPIFATRGLPGTMMAIRSVPGVTRIVYFTIGEVEITLDHETFVHLISVMSEITKTELEE